MVCRLLSCCMHVGSSSPTRDQTRVPYVGSVESYPLDYQESPKGTLAFPIMLYLCWRCLRATPNRLQICSWIKAVQQRVFYGVAFLASGQQNVPVVSEDLLLQRSLQRVPCSLEERLEPFECLHLEHGQGALMHLSLVTFYVFLHHCFEFWAAWFPGNELQIEVNYKEIWLIKIKTTQDLPECPACAICRRATISVTTCVLPF